MVPARQRCAQKNMKIHVEHRLTIFLSIIERFQLYEEHIGLLVSDISKL